MSSPPSVSYMDLLSELQTYDLNQKTTVAKTKETSKVASWDDMLKDSDMYDLKKLSFIKENKQLKEEASKKCRHCDGAMKKHMDEFTLVCSDCSHTIIATNDGEHTYNTGGNYNISGNSYVNQRMVGKGSRRFRNALTRYTSNYAAKRNTGILIELVNLNFVNKQFKLTPRVLEAARDMFVVLKNHGYRRRATKRLGVIGACVYVACQKASIAKVKKDIALLMGVEEARITYGLKELQYFHNIGVINIPQSIDPSCNLVNAYFSDLGIVDKYKPFVMAMINRITKTRINKIESRNVVTKCIGIVYALSVALKLNIQHDEICKSCDGISRGTYIHVYNDIVANKKKLLPVFSKYKIPLLPQWM